ncbi:MAG TPA: imidazole glycerol phosphate synthase subunit HisH [Lachnospiraceae bacterium]|nr:imidazole glycerol phosphate synthase subunit HisH [Lachnospiraceae bacterium]
MVAIIDYNAGNLKSVQKAFDYIGKKAICTRDYHDILNADRVVLPGVGSFEYAINELRKYELDKAIYEVCEKNIPFLGVCLGLQLLFERSMESPDVKGLSLLEGEIVRFPDDNNLKVPHIGWNSLELHNDGRLFRGIDDGAFVYFVHSYYLRARNEEIVTASCDYGVNVHASIEKDNIFACQFHPEKSSTIGLKILENFTEI